MALAVSILKYMILLLIVLLAAWLFFKGNPSGVAFGAITEELEASGFMDDMENVDTEDAQMFLGISADDCMEFYYAATPKQGDVTEILVVQTDNDRNSDRVIKALNTRIHEQIEYFEKEDAKQTSILKNAVIKRQGTYIIYVVSEYADSLENVFLDILNQR